MKQLSFIFICVALIQPKFVLAQAGDAVAGKVIFSSGNNTVISAAGQQRVIKQGDAVRSGDKLQTDGGRLQIRFTDSGFVSLKPKSQLVINQYAFNGKEDGTEKAFFSLLKGSIRAVSGMIGKHNKDSYKYETPVATIGIRGTAFVLILCNDDCYAQDGSLLPNGLYANNGEGRIYIKTGEGTLDLVRGQFAFVADVDSKPRQIIQPPAMGEMFQDEADTYDFDLDVTENTVEEIRQDPPVVEPPVVEPPVSIGEVQSLSITLSGGDLGLVPNTLTDLETDSIVTDGNDAVIEFDFLDVPNGLLVHFDSSDAELISGRSGRSADVGATWGIWEGGFSYIHAGTPLENNPQYLAYMGFSEPTPITDLPMTGNANFNIQLDTSANGAINLITGQLSDSFTASIGVNWFSGSFNNFDLAATFPDGSSFDMQMFGSINSVAISSAPLEGTFDNGGSQSAIGTANFQFANNAEVIGGTFNVRNVDNFGFAIGTFLLGQGGRAAAARN